MVAIVTLDTIFTFVTVINTFTKVIREGNDNY
jgi:hypothetical protein